jgi:O-antigen ligase
MKVFQAFYKYATERPHPLLIKGCCFLLFLILFFIPLSTAATNFLVAIFLIFFVASGGFFYWWSIIKIQPLCWAFIALYLVFPIGAIYTVAQPDEALWQISKYSNLLMALPAVLVLHEKPVWQQRALFSFMAAMALTLAASYLHSIWPFSWARSTHEQNIHNHYIFKHHITQNVLMAFFAYGCAIWAYIVENKKIKILAVVLSGLAIFNILFMVQGRTGHLALGLVIVLLWISCLSWRWRWYSLLMISLIGIAVAFIPNTLKSRILASHSEIVEFNAENFTSAGLRLYFWDKSIKLILQKPLFGWGTGAYAKKYCELAENRSLCRDGYYNPHNQFLYIMVQTGLWGGLIFLIWIVFLVMEAFKHKTIYKNLTLGLITIFLVHCMLDSPLFIATEGYFYSFMLSILLMRPSRSLEKNQNCVHSLIK